MSLICPTITALEPHAYREQAERIEPFAGRWHIDIADGVLAPRELINPKQLWWPENVTADIHVMYTQPLKILDSLLELQPHLIILHAEAIGSFAKFADAAHARGINVGVALLPTTPLLNIKPALASLDHVLIFSGNLGYQGGSTANLELLSKARVLRKAKPELEIGWDGGINDANIAALAGGGIDVLNVGGYIQNAADPKAAYISLQHNL